MTVWVNICFQIYNRKQSRNTRELIHYANQTFENLRNYRKKHALVVHWPGRATCRISCALA